VSRSKQKRESFKEDIAKFINESVAPFTADPDQLYAALRDMWLERFEKGEKNPPKVKELSERLGWGQATTSRMMSKLVKSGRVIDTGSHAHRVYIPEEFRNA
jgi:hypothetical protein